LEGTAGDLGAETGNIGLLAHLFQLPIHRGPLAVINPCENQPKPKGSDLDEGLPPWGLIGTACAGFLLGWWGWHNIRNNRNVCWG
jgi:hypothetical protein